MEHILKKMSNDVWEKEKLAVKHMVGDLVIAVLWQPSCHHAEGDTALHHIRVERANSGVIAKVEKVR